MNITIKLTIRAVNISFPRRAKRPRPSDDALRCDAQMSPSVRILCSIERATSLEKKQKGITNGNPDQAMYADNLQRAFIPEG